MPQTAVPPEPNWLEFANDILEALTRSSSAHWAFATKSTSARTPLKRMTTPQSDYYEDIDPVMAAMFTGYHAATASKAFRKKRPRADVAQSILRFSKTFGALSQFETQLHAYGRIMLMNVAPDLHEAVQNLVPHILKMTEVTQKAFVIDLEDVLDQAASDGSVLSAAFTEKLNGDVPILILASSHAPLPTECRALISTTVTLPLLVAAVFSPKRATEISPPVSGSANSKLQIFGIGAVAGSKPDALTEARLEQSGERIEGDRFDPRFTTTGAEHLGHRAQGRF